VLIATAFVWIGAGILVTQVEVETDILSLVPRDNPVVDAFRSTVERFGTVDTLLVVLRLEPSDDIEPTLAFADSLATEIREWDLIDWIEYRFEDPETAALPLLERATLFLTEDEIDDLIENLEPEHLETAAERLKGQLLAPQGLVAKELLTIDPIGLLPKILAKVRFGGVGARFDSETGCLIDDDRRFLLMMAKPIRPAQDIRFDAILAEGLSERVAAVTEEWLEEDWGVSPPVVEFTGGYIIALDDSQLIISDVVVGAVSSLVGVMLLFLLAFRRRAALLYAFVPLVTGLGLTFAFVVVTLGRLNSATSAFGGLLIGLGIDFIIVLYARYVEEGIAGASHDEAIDAMGRHTGVGVLLGAVTTAATFYAFLITDFRGLSELGLLTGTGILLLVVTVFLLLPALLTQLQARRSRVKRLYLHSFGSDLVCRWSLCHPGTVLVATVVVTLALGWAALDLEFDDDIRNMRSEDNRGVRLRQEVMDAFGLRFSPMTIRVDGATEAEALETARRLVPELQGLVDAGVLANVDTIAGLIPSADAQKVVIRRLAESGLNPALVVDEFRQALRRVGLNPAGFEKGLSHLTSALAVEKPLSLRDLEGSAIERVVARYVASYSDGVSTAVYCYPPAGQWRRMAPPQLEALANRHPEVVLAGTNVVSAELRRIVWGDAAKAAVLGMIVVFLLMWADLGSPLRSILALAPLGIGIVWMLGVMAFLGVRINFMNIFVLTMIIGIGVDYGVHLLHRWFESGGEPEAVSETAKAIAVAALTTMVGLGSLVLSHYPGLRSVGVAAILGAAATATLSITLLPVMLQKFSRSD